MLNLATRGFWDPQRQMVSANGFVGPDSFFVRASVSMGHDLWAPSRCVGPGCTPQHPSWNPKTCKSVPPPPPPPAPPLSPLEKRPSVWNAFRHQRWWRKAFQTLGRVIRCVYGPWFLGPCKSVCICVLWYVCPCCELALSRLQVC